MIVMQCRIIRKNVLTSNAQQSCLGLLNLCSRFIAHIPIRVFEELLYGRNYEVRRRLAMSDHEKPTLFLKIIRLCYFILILVTHGNSS